MNRKFIVVVAGLLFGTARSSLEPRRRSIRGDRQECERGSVSRILGPTPGHASEMAVVKCSQDSFIPPSCKVVSCRMDCPPPVCLPPMRKPIRKAKVSGTYPASYSWGRPMP